MSNNGDGNAENGPATAAPAHNDIVDLLIAGARVIDVVREHSGDERGGRVVVVSYGATKYWLETDPGGVRFRRTGSAAAAVPGVAR